MPIKKATVPKFLMRTEADKRALAEGCYYDRAAADRVCRFFKRMLVLPHGPPEMIGKPYPLIPWQEKEILRPLFGWKRPDGRRRFIHFGVWVPKKNNKTCLAAGILNYLMFGEQKRRKDIYSASRTLKQSSRIFKDCCQMFSPALANRANITESRKTIEFTETGNMYYALASDAGNIEGARVYGLILDEVHVFPNRTLYESLEYGIRSEAAFDEPLMGDISTAGIYDTTSIGWERFSIAKSIKDGNSENTRFLPVIYAMNEDVDIWDDPKVIKRCNPSIGYTLSLDVLLADAEDARVSSAKQASYERYSLNRWIAAVNACLGAGAWAACKDEEPSGLKERKCFGGLDVGMRRDLSAFVLYWPKTETEKAWIKVWFWMPSASLIRTDIVNVTQFAAWVREGLIKPLDGELLNYHALARDIEQISTEYDFDFVGYDKWHADGVAVDLEDLDFEMIDIPQWGKNLNEPLDDLIQMVTDRKIGHDGNEVMSWMSGNLESEEDRLGYKKPKKNHKDSTKKIDGFSAAINAVCMATSEEAREDNKFVYTGMGYDSEESEQELETNK